MNWRSKWVVLAVVVLGLATVRGGFGFEGDGEADHKARKPSCQVDFHGKHLGKENRANYHLHSRLRLTSDAEWIWSFNLHSNEDIKGVKPVNIRYRDHYAEGDSAAIRTDLDLVLQTPGIFPDAVVVAKDKVDNLIFCLSGEVQLPPPTLELSAACLDLALDSKDASDHPLSSVSASPFFPALLDYTIVSNDTSCYNPLPASGSASPLGYEILASNSVVPAESCNTSYTVNYSDPITGVSTTCSGGVSVEVETLPPCPCDIGITADLRIPKGGVVPEEWDLRCNQTQPHEISPGSGEFSTLDNDVFFCGFAADGSADFGTCIPIKSSYPDPYITADELQACVIEKCIYDGAVYSCNALDYILPIFTGGICPDAFPSGVPFGSCHSEHDLFCASLDPPLLCATDGNTAVCCNSGK